MQQTLKSILLSLFLLTGCSSIDLPQEKKTDVLMMPVNATGNPKIYLNFTIPKGFLVPNSELIKFNAGKIPALYLKPSSDSIFASNLFRTVLIKIPDRVYSLHMDRGKGLLATTFVEATILMNTKYSLHPKSQVFKVNAVDKKNYEMADGFIQILDIDMSTRMMYVQAYSGQLDMSAVIYSEKTERWLEGEELYKKADEIKAQMSKYVSIVGVEPELYHRMFLNEVSK